jgi:hypothetical protein
MGGETDTVAAVGYVEGLVVGFNVGPSTITSTGRDGMPFATTTNLPAPTAKVAGTVKYVNTGS